MDCGNRIVRIEMLATLSIIKATSFLHAFIIDVGMMSNGDVMLGANSISLTTSVTVTGGNMVRQGHQCSVSGTICLLSVLGAEDFGLHSSRLFYATSTISKRTW